MRENGEIESLTAFNIIWSQPILSFDEQFISLRAEFAGQYRLYILDLNDGGVPMFVDLNDEVPEIVAGNDFDSLPYGFYNILDDWHPTENKLVYADQNAINVYDPLTRTSYEIAASKEGSQLSRPIWVCSDETE
jgi:hypothetical protein